MSTRTSREHMHRPHLLSTSPPPLLGSPHGLLHAYITLTHNHNIMINLFSNRNPEPMSKKLQQLSVALDKLHLLRTLGHPLGSPIGRERMPLSSCLLVFSRELQPGHIQCYSRLRATHSAPRQSPLITCHRHRCHTKALPEALPDPTASAPKKHHR